jgi:hypothetical protein
MSQLLSMKHSRFGIGYAVLFGLCVLSIFTGSATAQVRSTPVTVVNDANNPVPVKVVSDPNGGVMVTVISSPFFVDLRQYRYFTLLASSNTQGDSASLFFVDSDNPTVRVAAAECNNGGGYRQWYCSNGNGSAPRFDVGGPFLEVRFSPYAPMGTWTAMVYLQK